jgi:DNA (cytosine-5)-methyltransferase 1
VLKLTLMSTRALHSLEICAGAGGQALGLEQAGFCHAGLIENDPDACKTLVLNRPSWNVLEKDLRQTDGRPFRGIDLLAGGVPCPPFSVAGRQLGEDDERDLFPTALRLIEECAPPAIMLENVPGFASAKFGSYRRNLIAKLRTLGYEVDWQVLNACNYGVPQLRPRFILVGLKGAAADRFSWPKAIGTPPSVGDVLYDLMSKNRWPGAFAWCKKAKGIGPTLVGGSKLHGGPDLGPTRARMAWAELGVDGRGLADDSPGADFPANAAPRLTVRMTARIQGFPDSWQFYGKKTAAYRQVGNAFPPPVARAVALNIYRAMMGLPVAANNDVLPFTRQTA